MTREPSKSYIRRGTARVGWALAACTLILAACDQSSKPKPEKPQSNPPVYVPPPQTKLPPKQQQTHSKPKPKPGTNPVAEVPGALGLFASLRAEDKNAWIGHQYLDGAMLRFHEFKNNPDATQYDIQLIESDASDGLAGLDKIFERKPQPVAVIGHVDTEEALRALPKYEETGLLMLPGPRRQILEFRGELDRLRYLGCSDTWALVPRLS